MNPRPAFVAWLVLAIAALLVSQPGHAQTCTTTRVTYNRNACGTPYAGSAYTSQFSEDLDGTSAAACNNLASAVSGGLAQYGTCSFGSPTAFTSVVGTVNTSTGVCTLDLTRSTGTHTFHTSSRTTFPGEPCPPADPCNTSSPGVGEDYAVGTTVPAESCHPISRCKLVRGPGVCIDGSCMYQVKHTDQQCDDGEADGSAPTAGEECATGSDSEFCSSGQGEKNCGWLNGNFTCLKSVEPDGCDVFGDGSRVCGASAPMPPVPDNGTPGQAATPDETVTQQNPDGSTTVNNFYNPTTVGASSRDPGTSGDNPHDGEDDGDGADEGADGDGDGDGEGEDESCPEGATCDGSLPDEFEEVCTFAECTQDFIDRVTESPMLAALDSVGSSFPSGTCPAVNITMFDETMSLSEPICDIWTGQIAGAISALMLIIFAWVATRVVLSA